MGGGGGALSDAAALVRLQAADDRITTLRAERTALQAALAGDPVLDRTQARARELADALAGADAAVADADAAAAALRSRARTVEKQLYGGSVRNPQDLLTLQRELDVLRQQLADAEEDELRRMQEAEEAAAARAVADAEVAEVEGRRAAAAGPTAERLATVSAALADAEAQRVETAAETSPAGLALYTRIAMRHQPAVARLSGGACSGCRLPLGAGEARALRTADTLVQCPNCDRILVP